MNPDEIVRDMPEVEKWNEEQPETITGLLEKIQEEADKLNTLIEEDPMDLFLDKELERDNNYLTDAKLGN